MTNIAQLEEQVKRLEAQRDQIKEDLATLRLFIEEESKQDKSLSAAKVFDRVQRERNLLLGAASRSKKRLDSILSSPLRLVTGHTHYSIGRCAEDLGTAISNVENRRS
jgi:septal ring factor EnvC (AmiA/AmiB activator)